MGLTLDQCQNSELSFLSGNLACIRVRIPLDEMYTAILFLRKKKEYLRIGYWMNHVSSEGLAYWMKHVPK